MIAPMGTWLHLVDRALYSMRWLVYGAMAGALLWVLW